MLFSSHTDFKPAKKAVCRLGARLRTWRPSLHDESFVYIARYPWKHFPHALCLRFSTRIVGRTAFLENASSVSDVLWVLGFSVRAHSTPLRPTYSMGCFYIGRIQYSRLRLSVENSRHCTLLYSNATSNQNGAVGLYLIVVQQKTGQCRKLPPIPKPS